jgi:hypothetical protein
MLSKTTSLKIELRVVSTYARERGESAPVGDADFTYGLHLRRHHHRLPNEELCIFRLPLGGAQRVALHHVAHAGPM